MSLNRPTSYIAKTPRRSHRAFSWPSYHRCFHCLQSKHHFHDIQPGLPHPFYTSICFIRDIVPFPEYRNGPICRTAGIASPLCRNIPQKVPYKAKFFIPHRITLIFEICTASRSPNIPNKLEVDWSKQLGGVQRHTDGQTTGIHPPITGIMRAITFVQFLYPSPSLRSGLG